MHRLGLLLVSAISLCTLVAIATWAGRLPPTATILVCSLVLAGLIIVVIAASAMPSLALFGPTHCRTGSHDAVALTFDDGPDPHATPALLEALGDRRATFFFLVDRAEAHPELARQVAARHQVGLHGLTHHAWLTVRSVDRGTSELLDAKRRLEAIVQTPVKHYRPPFGAVSPRLYESVAGAGLALIWCSLRTRDGGPITPETLMERCERAEGGDIVLLHDGPAHTVQALPRILERIEARGLRFDTVEALCPV